MAERIKNEETDTDIFQYFSGASEEIFEKLPKPDKRPYNIIGALAFLITILFGALVTLAMGRFTDALVIRLAAGITAIALINKLQKIIIGRLIHQFDSTNSFIFWGYGLLITFLFIICESAGLVNLSTIYPRQAADYDPGNVDSTQMRDTTISKMTIADSAAMMNSIKAADTTTSYPAKKHRSNIKK